MPAEKDFSSQHTHLDCMWRIPLMYWLMGNWSMQTSLNPHRAGASVVIGVFLRKRVHVIAPVGCVREIKGRLWLRERGMCWCAMRCLWITSNVFRSVSPGLYRLRVHTCCLPPSRLFICILSLSNTQFSVTVLLRTLCSFTNICF